MEQNSNPGFVLIGLSGTGSISWTNLKMIKTDRNGSLAVQLYSFMIIFFLCDFKFFPVSGREHTPHDVVLSFVSRLFKADTVVND